MIVICRVPNGKSDRTSSIQLQAQYTDGRHWEELIDLIKKNCCPKEPYYMTAIYKFNLTQEEWDEEYVGLYAPVQMMNVPPSVHISFSSSLSNAIKLKLGCNVKLFLVEMKAVTGKDIAEYVMRLAKMIPTDSVMVSYAPRKSVCLDFRAIRSKCKSRGCGGMWERHWQEY